MAKSAVVEVDWRIERGAIQEMALMDEISDEVRHVAESAIPIMQGIAPVRTGQYRAKVKVRVRTENVSKLRRRVAYMDDIAEEPRKGRPNGKMRYAWAVEWGNGAHHTLERTIAAMRKM